MRFPSDLTTIILHNGASVALSGALGKARGFVRSQASGLPRWVAGVWRRVLTIRKGQPTMARRTTARPLPAWVGDLPVFERTLPNGFRALVLPRTHTPIVVCDLYYPAGSFDEPAGKTGLAHFVEHMLFKGTERFPKGQIDRLAFVAAGQSNAETSEDATHYWFALPVRPLGDRPGDRSRPNAGCPIRSSRGRGRAPGHRRGACPRPRFAVQPA